MTENKFGRVPQDRIFRASEFERDNFRSQAKHAVCFVVG